MEKNLDQEIKEKKWEEVQIKAFTSWLNSYLQKRDLVVKDLRNDLKDGVILINFLEVLNDTELGKYYKEPSAPIYKIQNIKLVLDYISNKLGVKLVAIGPEDIVDGNLKLTLGMLFSLFIKLRIGSLVEEFSEGGQKGGKSKTEAALLNWIREMVEGYPHCKVEDFTTSFNDGMVFSALIHRFNPELIDYNSLDPNNAEFNLKNAFGIAEAKLGIPQLLDVEDMLSGNPDERSVVMYASLFLHTFAQNEERFAQIKKEREERRKRLEFLKQQRETTLSERQKLLETCNALSSEVDALTRRVQESDAAVAAGESANAALLAEKEALQRKLEELKRRVEERLRSRLARTEAARREAALAAARLAEENQRMARHDAVADGDRTLSGLDALRRNLREHVENLRAEHARLLRERAMEREMRAKKAREESEKAAARIAATGVVVPEAEKEKEREKEAERERAEAADAAIDKPFVFDAKTIRDELTAKRGQPEQQLAAIESRLATHSGTLLKLLQISDAHRVLEDVIDKSGYLMTEVAESDEKPPAAEGAAASASASTPAIEEPKTPGRRRWKKRWFELKGNMLHYYDNKKDSLPDGSIDLTECHVAEGTPVHINFGAAHKKKKSTAGGEGIEEPASAHTALAMAVNSENEPHFVIELEYRGQKLLAAAKTKVIYEEWLALLRGRIAYYAYQKLLKARPAAEARPDARLLHLFGSSYLPKVVLDGQVPRPLSREELALVVDFLSHHRELEVLSLSDAGLADDTLAVVAKVLGRLSNLRVLVLSKNNLTRTGAEALMSGGLAAATELTRIDVSENELDDDALTTLLPLVRNNRKLEAFELSRNRLTDKAVIALADALRESATSLASLNLTHNRIGDAGAAALATFLKGSTTVRSVCLDDNEIGDQGASALAEGLRGNSAVTTVSLSGNRISREGARELLELLKTNPTLKELNLSKNEKLLGGADFKPLAEDESITVTSLVLTRV